MDVIHIFIAWFFPLLEPGNIHASLMELDEISSKQQPGTLRGNWPTGFVTQYKYLTLRTFQLAKSRLLDPIKLLENLVVCVIFSLIWFQLPRSEETVRDRMGAVSTCIYLKPVVALHALEFSMNIFRLCVWDCVCLNWQE